MEKDWYCTGNIKIKGGRCASFLSTTEDLEIDFTRTAQQTESTGQLLYLSCSRKSADQACQPLKRHGDFEVASEEAIR
jgi:hypothetical protein